jgi:Amt family ammonium transporter
MNILGKMAFFRAVDDVFGVFHTHLVAGVLGGFLVGIFATAEACAAFNLTTPGGAIAGNGAQVGWQLAGAAFIIGWNVVWTSLIMCFIKYVCRVPLRMSDEDLLLGDDAVHGEAAYSLADDDVGSLMPAKSLPDDPEHGSELGTSSEPAEIKEHK